MVHFHLGNRFWDQEDTNIMVSIGDKSATVMQNDINDTSDGQEISLELKSAENLTQKVDIRVHVNMANQLPEQAKDIVAVTLSLTGFDFIGGWSKFAL
jgi:hypothetical protein